MIKARRIERSREIDRKQAQASGADLRSGFEKQMLLSKLPDNRFLLKVSSLFTIRAFPLLAFFLCVRSVNFAMRRHNYRAFFDDDAVFVV